MFRRTAEGFTEYNGYKAKDYERLRLKALDILEDKTEDIGQWVKDYVEIFPRTSESIHGYKNRLKKILNI